MDLLQMLIDARAEAARAREEMALAHEGLRDYEKLVTDATKQSVTPVRVIYDQRAAVLDDVVADLTDRIEDLQSNGYPELPKVEIPSSGIKDLEAQEASLAAARAIFTVGDAVTFGLSAAPPEKKPGR
jgi:hypothetical protein